MFIVFGIIFSCFLLFVMYGGAHLYVHKASRPEKVTMRLITNCGGKPQGHWLYDEHHIDRPAYERREKGEK